MGNRLVGASQLCESECRRLLVYDGGRADLGAALGRGHRWCRQGRRHFRAIRAAFPDTECTPIAVWPRRSHYGRIPTAPCTLAPGVRHHPPVSFGPRGIGGGRSYRSVTAGSQVVAHGAHGAGELCLFIRGAGLYLISDGFRRLRPSLLTGVAFGLLSLSRSIAIVYVAAAGLTILAAFLMFHRRFDGQLLRNILTAAAGRSWWPVYGHGRAAQ